MSMPRGANNYFPAAEGLLASPAPSMSEAKQIAVIGSLNIDYFVRVDVFPGPGETVAAEKLDTFHGGKGANQAVAAARQGCQVVLFGALGADAGGTAYRKALRNEGIDTTRILKTKEASGTAFITVDRNGENTIVTASGANGRLKQSDITRHADIIRSSHALIAQFEVPIQPLVEAARIANHSGVPVLINPSPALPNFPWDEFRSDYVIVNETEAGLLLGFSAMSESISLVRERLFELRAAHLIITRGSNSTLVFRKEGEPLSIPALPVVPVDTVGAGDAFAGCFAARIACGESLTDALHAANCAGALTTLGAGAQDPIPDRTKVDQHIEYLKSLI